MTDAANPKLASSTYRWYVVLLLAVLYIVSYADRLVIGILVDPIKSDLGVNDTQMGFLLGFSFAALYAALALVLARVADRHNRRNLIVVGVLIWSVMTSASAFADGFWQLALCRLGVGIGEAALGPAALSMISDLFEKRRRHFPISAFLAAGVIGATGAFIIGGGAVLLVSQMSAASMPWADELAPWRYVLLLMGLPGIALGLLMAVTVAEPARVQDAESMSASAATSKDIARHLMSNRLYYAPLFGGMVLVQMVLFAVAAWYPSVLIRLFGLPISQAGIAFGSVGVIFGTAGAILGPHVAGVLERNGRSDALILVCIATVAIGAPAVIFAPIAPTVSLSLAAMAIAMFCLMAGGAMSPLLPQLIAPNVMRAQVTAVYFFMANVIGLGASPLLIGILNDTGAFGVSGVHQAVSLMGAILMPIALLVLVFSWRALRRNSVVAAPNAIPLRP